MVIVLLGSMWGRGWSYTFLLSSPVKLGPWQVGKQRAAQGGYFSPSFRQPSSSAWAVPPGECLWASGSPWCGFCPFGLLVGWGSPSSLHVGPLPNSGWRRPRDHVLNTAWTVRPASLFLSPLSLSSGFVLFCSFLRWKWGLFFKVVWYNYADVCSYTSEQNSTLTDLLILLKGI